MRKRVLVVEQSDAIRGVAETVLRQNGFEVISVAAAEKALEVLKFTHPDLMIIGGELTTADQRPLYDKLQSDPNTASIALLLFDDAEGGALPFPAEVVIPRPFNPTEFLEKVMVFSGRSKSIEKQPALNPLEEASLDDDFLDAALGLDRIDVTDSEVMNRTGGVGVKKTTSRSSAKDVGFDHVEKNEQEQTESGKVESVMIRDGTGTDIGPHPQQKKPRPTPSASGKLEILTDQYGLADADAFKAATGNQAHDYEWFLNEMRKESETSQVSSPTAGSSPTDKAPASELTISEPASLVDPVTPAPKVRDSTRPRPKVPQVEKFIDEFKKEIEKVRAKEPESIMIGADNPPGGKTRTTEEKKWEESLESITSEQIGLFTRQLCSELAEKIANKIVSRIDNDKLLTMIKNEILARSRNKS